MIQAGDVGSHLDGATLGINHAGRGEHDGANSAGGGVVVGGARQTGREPSNLVDGPRSAAAVGGFVDLSDDSARNIRESDCQSSGSQVDAEHVTTFWAQFVQHGGSPDIAAGSSGRADQTLLFEGVD